MFPSLSLSFLEHARHSSLTLVLTGKKVGSQVISLKGNLMTHVRDRVSGASSRCKLLLSHADKMPHNFNLPRSFASASNNSRASKVAVKRNTVYRDRSTRTQEPKSMNASSKRQTTGSLSPALDRSQVPDPSGKGLSKMSVLDR